MKKKPVPENSCPESGKLTAEPLAEQAETLPLVGSGGVCKECLGEDFDTCVCPEPDK